MSNLQRSMPINLKMYENRSVFGKLTEVKSAKHIHKVLSRNLKGPSEVRKQER